MSALIDFGNETSAPYATQRTGSYPHSIAIGDAQRDGDLDLAIANFDSAAVSVLQNFGFGSVAPQPTYGTRSSSSSPALDDLERDGDHDLAVNHWTNDTLSVPLGLCR